MASSTYADQDPWATLLLFMSQGGDDAALIIADVNDQYDTALLADFNNLHDVTYTALLAATSLPSHLPLSLRSRNNPLLCLQS